MNEYSICFKNGMSGNCDIDCEQFISSNCDSAYDVVHKYDNSLSDEDIDLINDLYPGVLNDEE